MPALDFEAKPTNMTRVGDDKSKRDGDVILYILIVVGASVFLLLIPLVSFVVRWSKRKLRRRRRRKQAERAHARVMAEKEIIEKRMYENQLAKRQMAKPPPLQLESNGAELGVPPRSPIQQDSTQPEPVSLSPPPRSPIRNETEQLNGKKDSSDLNLNGFDTQNGLTNKGYQTSMLSIPMRKSTSDLYLPNETSIVRSSKRRFSEDLIGNHNKPMNGSVQEKLAAEILQRNASSDKTTQEENIHSIAEDANQEDANQEDAIQEEANKERVEQEDVKQVTPKGSPLLSKKALANEQVGKKEDNESDSDDYDDVCENIYDNVDRNDTDSDGPIYDNVKGIYDSDTDHIYSNVDGLSDTSSHIYTNVDESTCESDSREVDDDDSGEDAYENINFVYRKRESRLNSTDADESDASSVSYENLWEDEDDEANESESEKSPPLVPRRIPKTTDNVAKMNGVNVEKKK